MYTREDEDGWNQSNQFKKTFSIDVDIEFVGVWHVPFSARDVSRSYAVITIQGHRGLSRIDTASAALHEVQQPHPVLQARHLT